MARAKAGQHNSSRKRFMERIGAFLRSGWSAPAALAILFGLLPFVPQIQNMLGLGGGTAIPVYSALTQENHPSVVVWSSGTRNPPGQEDVFWKGSGDSRLWEAVMNNGWQGPQSVPRVSNVASAPAAVVNTALNREDIYWTGADNQLWEDVWAGKWSGPHTPEMGSLGSAPSVAVWPSVTRNPPGQEDVFWKGSGDSRLWEAVMNNGWQAPRSVPRVSNVASAPAAVVNAALNQEEIYWTGTDHHLWDEVWDGEWSGPYDLGMGSLGSAPSVAVWPGGTRDAPGQVDVFWKGSGDSRLWEAVMNNGWQGPQSVPGVSNVASAPAAVVNAALNQEDIYWTSTDHRLWREVWAGKWSGPHELGVGTHIVRARRTAYTKLR